MRSLFLVAGFLGLAGSAGATHVPGRAFDRFITIWLENQDYAKVAKDPVIAKFKKEGILLTNYYAQTHPSQPNYIAAIAGDYFGMDHDSVVRVPLNVSTVVDLLDWRGLSWKAYMENIPGPGFMYEGSTNYEGKWDYVRKHNPFVSFDSINRNGSRLLNIQSFRDFRRDLAAKTVPQYAFMTPNMLNDGHNTTLEYATKWADDFITPLLADGVFGERTLIMLTYDESETYSRPNKIVTLLLGTGLPPEKKGTEDNTFYTHYSILSTLQYNWGLPNLGRYDVGANVFQYVLDMTQGSGARPNRDPPNVAAVDNSASYPGALNSDPSKFLPIPPPNLKLRGAGAQGVLLDVRKLWQPQADELSPYDGSGRLYDAKTFPVYKPQSENGR